LLTALRLADVEITYRSSRGGDLDTRLLRANVIKGILEEITTANVNMVNADLLAEQRGLRITETITRVESPSVLSEIAVRIKTPDSKFSGAILNNAITVAVRPLLMSTYCKQPAVDESRGRPVLLSTYYKQLSNRPSSPSRQYCPYARPYAPPCHHTTNALTPRMHAPPLRHARRVATGAE
jgi:hypothetical protein